MESPKYNKSNLMKTAWRMFKAGKKIRRHVLSFAECLKEAWILEKQRFAKALSLFNIFNKAAEENRKYSAQRNVKVASMDFMADTLVNYYSNNTYNGD